MMQKGKYMTVLQNMLICSGMPEQVSRPNPWMMVVMMMMLICEIQVFLTKIPSLHKILAAVSNI